ncbi:recombinase family protein [Mesorhizobium sp. M0254]|uniref:recombinase family protein n=1 Tax=Mesorhizobium sp. M0254 TaxID=2956927 RepID=UPI0033368F24
MREAIGLVFTRFAEMQSIRQVFLSLRSDQIALPYINPRISGQQQVLWKPPVSTTVSNLLTNPVYAGAYAFGRTGSRTIIENGRKRIVRGRRKARSDWAVLLVDHHEGYLPWADFERNQRLITDNANGKGMMVRGPVRKGEALLAGLLRCGHCGRRLLVGYNGAKGDVGRYKCDATRSNPDGDPCISFGALRVDEAVGAEIVRLLQPLGVEAAIQAIAQCEHQSGEKQRQNLKNESAKASFRSGKLSVCGGDRMLGERDHGMRSSQLVRRVNAFAHRTACVVPTRKIVFRTMRSLSQPVSHVGHSRRSDNDCNRRVVRARWRTTMAPIAADRSNCLENDTTSRSGGRPLMRDEDFESKPRKNVRYRAADTSIRRCHQPIKLVGRKDAAQGSAASLRRMSASPPFRRASSSSPVSSTWMESDFSGRPLICAISSAMTFDRKPGGAL